MWNCLALPYLFGGLAPGVTTWRVMLQLCLCSSPKRSQMRPALSSGRCEFTPQGDVFPQDSCGPRLLWDWPSPWRPPMTRAFLLDGLQAGLSPLWGGGRAFSLESIILGSATHFVHCFICDPLWNKLFFAVFYIFKSIDSSHSNDFS